MINLRHSHVQQTGDNEDVESMPYSNSRSPIPSEFSLPIYNINFDKTMNLKSGMKKINDNF